MGTRRKVDTENLMKRIRQGMVRKDTLKKFGFNDSTVIEGAPEIKKATASNPTPKIDKLVKVNKWGSISIPKYVVELLLLKEGDSFQVRKTKAGISLKLD
jgi:AbrB family looped-hinge helix DNA binding protein